MKSKTTTAAFGLALAALAFCNPSAAYADGPQCTTPTAPMLPTSQDNGTHVFFIAADALCADLFYIEVPIATGYDILVNGSSIFQVGMPSAVRVPDADGYQFLIPSTIYPLNLFADDVHAISSLPTSIKLQGIDPLLVGGSSTTTSFLLGLKLLPQNSDVELRMTPVPANNPPPPPAPVYGLGGGRVTVTQGQNLGSAVSATVTPGIEFFNLHLKHGDGTNYGNARWDIDVDADTVRVTFVQSGGAASYGPGFRLNFSDLAPSLPGCTGTPMINGVTMTSSRSDVPHAIDGAGAGWSRVVIPLGPPVTEPNTTYDWDNGDWVEAKLTFMCRPAEFHPFDPVPDLPHRVTPMPNQSDQGTTTKTKKKKKKLKVKLPWKKKQK